MGINERIRLGGSGRITHGIWRSSLDEKENAEER